MTMRNSVMRIVAAGLTAVVAGGAALVFFAPAPATADGPAFSVNSIGVDSVVVGWKTDAKPAGATKYTVEWRQGSGAPQAVDVQLVIGGIDMTGVVISGLSAGTPASFRVQAASESGPISDWSGPVVKTPKTQTSAKTSKVNITNINSIDVELNWKNVGGGTTGYLVRARCLKDCTGKPYRYAATTSTGVTIRNLAPATKYRIEVADADVPDNDIFVPKGADNVPLQSAVRRGPYASTGNALSVLTKPARLAAPSKFVVPPDKDPTSISANLAWDQELPEGQSELESGWQYQLDYGTNSEVNQGTWADASGWNTRGSQKIGAPNSDGGPVCKSKEASTTLHCEYTTPNKLVANRQYYMRLKVVDGAGAQVSDRSAYVLVKTRTPHGYIWGTIKSDEPGFDPTKVAVAAFDEGNLIRQASVGANGSYHLAVPVPNSGSRAFKVRAIYLGDDGWASRWLSTAPSPGRVSAEAKVLNMSVETKLENQDITLAKGYSISGSVGSWTNSTADVTALFKPDGGAACSTNATREALGLTRSANDDSFEIKGLANGTYCVRARAGGESRYSTVILNGGNVNGVTWSRY